MAPLSRRSLLTGAGLAGAGLVAGGAAGTAAGVAVTGGTGPDDVPRPRFLAFHGEHQTAVTAAAPAAGLMAALDVVGDDRDALTRALADLGEETEHLMSGRSYPVQDPALPPPHTGTLGDSPAPADLSVAVAVGASLFDDRFGLADRRPRELVTMPVLANDRLDPARTHGDLLLTISADSVDATMFALRQLLRRTRSTLVLRWMVEGFNRRSRPVPGQAPARNLLGFKDGTSNLDGSDEEAMRRHVWVGPDDGEPAWAVGGTYQAVRVVRMLVEFWDRTPLTEQETLIGRRKESGAPLDGTAEIDVPDYDADPEGDVTPLDAHIRLANPRTPDSQESLILRRGFSYSRGFDGAGQLDQGLAFVSFQRSLERGFLAVQRRLSGEPLEEYIRTEGGGFFFALPGVREPGDVLGRGLVED